MVPHVSSHKLLPGSANKNKEVRVHVTTTEQVPQSAKRCDGDVFDLGRYGLYNQTRALARFVQDPKKYYSNRKHSLKKNK